MVTSRGIYARQRIWAYWHQTGNKFDVVGIFLFFLGFAFRMGNGSIYVEIGRILYTLDLMVFIMCLLNYFSLSKTLGPYIVMITKMVSNNWFIQASENYLFYTFTLLLGVFLKIQDYKKSC